MESRRQEGVKMNDAEKLAAIAARIELLNSDDADKWSSQPRYAIEDIGRILEDLNPLSTKENQR